MIKNVKKSCWWKNCNLCLTNETTRFASTEASFASISASVASVVAFKTPLTMLWIKSLVEKIGSTPYRTYSPSIVLNLFLVLKATGLVSMSKETIVCMNSEYFMKSIANSGIVRVKVVDFL